MGMPRHQVCTGFTFFFFFGRYTHTCSLLWVHKGAGLPGQAVAYRAIPCCLPGPYLPRYRRAHPTVVFMARGSRFRGGPPG